MSQNIAREPQRRAVFLWLSIMSTTVDDQCVELIERAVVGEHDARRVICGSVEVFASCLAELLRASVQVVVA